MTTKSPAFTVRTSAPDGLDDADGLVAHALARRRLGPRLVRPEVAAADAGAGDADDRVGRVDDRGVGDVLDANVAGLVHDGCTHGGLPVPVTRPASSARYCSSLTCSIQSTGLPLSASWMAMWRHGRGRRGAVPVLLARLEPDHVARPDLLDRPALALDPAAARRHDQRLAERVGVPGRARARLEGDQGAGDARRIGRAESADRSAPCR